MIRDITYWPYGHNMGHTVTYIYILTIIWSWYETHILAVWSWYVTYIHWPYIYGYELMIWDIHIDSMVMILDIQIDHIWSWYRTYNMSYILTIWSWFETNILVTSLTSLKTIKLCKPAESLRWIELPGNFSYPVAWATQ